jgi:hypothetical protein
VNLAEPDRIKAERVAEVYLRQDILVPLMFGNPSAQGRWSKNPKRKPSPFA